MVVLNQNKSDDPTMYDLSFMYTKKCDLTCAFCMYSSSPKVGDAMDLAALWGWLETVDFDRVASFGAYGGEVGIALDGFGACFDLVAHIDRPHFVITNGTWSVDTDRTTEFLEFCAKYRCHIVVSGTPWHRRHQNRKVLEALAEEQPEAFRLKPVEENFHAMGKLEGKMKFSCSTKCMSWDRALRIAVQPDGTIIFQNCDGVYPVVGHLGEPFSVIDERVMNMRTDGFSPVCSHYEASPTQGDRVDVHII